MTEMPETMTLTLAKPVTFAGQTYETLNLREPTAGEVAQFDKLERVESDILAVSLVAGVPKGAAEKIGARDFMTAARFIGGFLFGGQPTGESA